MADSRERAHLAMRKLWEAVDGPEGRLRHSDVASRERNGTMERRVETKGGAFIEAIGDLTTVAASFEKTDGTEETVIVGFPADIRDLSTTTVQISWSNDQDSGVNTAPLREFPRISLELLELL